MLHWIVSAGFKNIEEPDDIAVYVNLGISY